MRRFAMSSRAMKEAFLNYRADCFNSSCEAVVEFKRLKDKLAALSETPQYRMLELAFGANNLCDPMNEFEQINMMVDLIKSHKPYAGPQSVVDPCGAENYCNAFHYAVQRNLKMAVRLFLKSDKKSTSWHVTFPDISRLVNAPLGVDADISLGLVRYNWTPLMTAAHLGNTLMVARLLTAGANADCEGQVARATLGEVGWRYKRTSVVPVGERRTVTPLQLASEAGHGGVVKLLQVALEQRNTISPTAGT